MEQRVFVLAKDCNIGGHVYPAGTQFEMFRGYVSKDGGMLMEGYQQLFRDFIEKELKSGKNLYEIKQVEHEL